MIPRFVVASVVLSFVTGCAYTKPRRKDAPHPGDPRVVQVDFQALFETPGRSNSVYAGKDPDQMRHLLLSPNLVFESSRSSLGEPNTQGPKSQEEVRVNAPFMDNALGEPVDMQLSSLLINYFANRPETNVFAPAVTKRWDVCATTCNSGTWVERLLQMYRQNREKDPSQPNLTAFAVRRLGFSTREVRVVVERSPERVLVVRNRRSDTEASVCPGVDRVRIPTVAFQAEIVSMVDGRLLARIDEVRSPPVGAAARRSIYANRFDPVKRTGHTVWTRGLGGDSPSRGRYEYVASYTEVDLECEGAVGAYRALFEDIYRNIDRHIAATANDLFRCALDPLYQRTPTPESPCAAPRPR